MESDKNEKGVIYTRFSSAGQREESIEGQLRDCHAFAEKYGITIVGEYCDRAITGTSDKRPDFQRMIRDSARGQFSIVITWKNDRFARSRYDSAIYKHKLKQNGVKVLYAKESIPDGPEGIILESVMEGFAEYYSANLSQNVKRGNYDSALKRQTLGQTVFGLKKGADKRFEIDPITSPIVKRIFTEYAAGRPAVDIYTTLNNEGYRTIKGNKFSKSSIRNILKNEKYAGVYKFADIRDENGIPPIVNKELFEKVQNMLDLHHKKPAAKRAEGGFLLTTKLFCGMCGAPMTSDSGTGRSGKVYSYYICTNRKAKKCKKERVSKTWIEDLIVNELVKIVNNDAIINEFADRFMLWQEGQKDNYTLKSLEKSLKQTENAIKNTMHAIDSGIITQSVKSHLVELESNKIELEKSIAKEKLESPKLERDSIVWFLSRFKKCDISDTYWRIFLVDTFLQAAYLYDNGKLLLSLNFSGKNNKINVKILEEATTNGEILCSNFKHAGAPRCPSKPVHKLLLFASLFSEHLRL